MGRAGKRDMGAMEHITKKIMADRRRGGKKSKGKKKNGFSKQLCLIPACIMLVGKRGRGSKEGRKERNWNRSVIAGMY